MIQPSNEQIEGIGQHPPPREAGQAIVPEVQEGGVSRLQLDSGGQQDMPEGEKVLSSQTVP